MANKNLLSYVQDCLSTMDSDEVDTINETTESTQVANLFKDLYFELLNREDWNFLKGPVTLVSPIDVLYPTSLTIPDNVTFLIDVWYNIDEAGAVNKRRLIYRTPEEWQTTFGSTSSSSRQLVTLPSQIQFYVTTDRHPTYYTSFDNKSVVFDSFKSSVDSVITASKVSCYGVSLPSFSGDDTFVPLLPDHMVPLMQHTLNAAAHLYFKQAPSPVDEQRIARQMAQSRRRESKVERETYYQNQFGRVSGSWTSLGSHGR